MEAPGTDYYKEYSNRFYTQLISIEAEKLKSFLTESGLDYESFSRGEYGLLASDNPNLFPDDMTLQFQCGQINQYEIAPDGMTKELFIGGFLPSSYYGGLSSDAPYIFVSDAGMEHLAPNAFTASLGIDTNSLNEAQIISEVRTLCNQSGEIAVISKAELIEGLHSAKITLYTLGG